MRAGRPLRKTPRGRAAQSRAMQSTAQPDSDSRHSDSEGATARPRRGQRHDDTPTTVRPKSSVESRRAPLSTRLAAMVIDSGTRVQSVARRHGTSGPTRAAERSHHDAAERTCENSRPHTKHDRSVRRLARRSPLTTRRWSPGGLCTRHGQRTHDRTSVITTTRLQHHPRRTRRDGNPRRDHVHVGHAANRSGYCMVRLR
jgi:hypothetical protein